MSVDYIKYVKLQIIKFLHVDGKAKMWQLCILIDFIVRLPSSFWQIYFYATKNIQKYIKFLK